MSRYSRFTNSILLGSTMILSAGLAHASIPATEADSMGVACGCPTLVSPGLALAEGLFESAPPAPSVRAGEVSVFTFSWQRDTEVPLLAQQGGTAGSGNCSIKAKIWSIIYGVHCSFYELAQ